MAATSQRRRTLALRAHLGLGEEVPDGGFVVQDEGHAADPERERPICRGDHAGGSPAPSGLPPRSATPSAPSSSAHEFVESRHLFVVIRIFHAGILAAPIYIRISYPVAQPAATMNSARKSGEMTSRLLASVGMAASFPCSTLFHMRFFKYSAAGERRGRLSAQNDHARTPSPICLTESCRPAGRPGSAECTAHRRTRSTGRGPRPPQMRRRTHTRLRRARSTPAT